MKIRRFSFAFAFVMERQINSPRFSFTFAFKIIMLGTHKPEQQATLTNKNKIPEIFFLFHFRNSTERKSQIMGFLFIFACNCFCEDGSCCPSVFLWLNFQRFVLLWSSYPKYPTVLKMLRVVNVLRVVSALPGEIQKGTGGRGRDRKCHKLSWRLSQIVVTFYDDLWRFMTFYVNGIQRDGNCHKMSQIVVTCRKSVSRNYSKGELSFPTNLLHYMPGVGKEMRSSPFYYFCMPDHMKDSCLPSQACRDCEMRAAEQSKGIYLRAALILL